MDDDAKRGPGRGGYRTGGGRPRGAKNNRSKEGAINARVAEVCQTLGIEIHPIFREMNSLELQVFVMKLFATAGLEAKSRDEQIRLLSMSASVGEKVSPYLYPKQASVTQDITIDTDRKQLSTAELKARAAAVLDVEFEELDDAVDKLLTSS